MITSVALRVAATALSFAALSARPRPKIPPTRNTEIPPAKERWGRQGPT